MDRKGVGATLDEVLAEPITRLVMRRDGVSEDDIRRVMARLAHRLWLQRPPSRA